MLYIILLITVILIYIWNNPTLAFVPYNLFIDIITEKKVFYTSLEKRKIFPISSELESNYLAIKREALGVFDYIKGNVGQGYINEKDNFWQGWNTFPLRMFGNDIKSNMVMCPTLSKILRKCSNNVPTAFFSVMEPHKRLDAHYGPFKGILRYHLGLLIPPSESGECFISVDDIKYYWREGEGKLFDETYLHYVHNDTPYHRIILFLDIKRKFDLPIMNHINDLILYLINISPHNQKVVKQQSSILNKLLLEC